MIIYFTIQILFIGISDLSQWFIELKLYLILNRFLEIAFWEQLNIHVWDPILRANHLTFPFCIYYAISRSTFTFRYIYYPHDRILPHLRIHPREMKCNIWYIVDAFIDIKVFLCVLWRHFIQCGQCMRFDRWLRTTELNCVWTYFCVFYWWIEKDFYSAFLLCT